MDELKVLRKMVSDAWRFYQQSGVKQVAATYHHVIQMIDTVTAFRNEQILKEPKEEPIRFDGRQAKEEAERVGTVAAKAEHEKVKKVVGETLDEHIRKVVREETEKVSFVSPVEQELEALRSFRVEAIDRMLETNNRVDSIRGRIADQLNRIDATIAAHIKSQDALVQEFGKRLRKFEEALEVKG